MELRNILTKIGSNKEERRETFLALEISHETVKSAAWAVEHKKTIVIKMGSTEEWDEDDKESLIIAVDKTISNVCEGMEEEPKKVILGLLGAWASGEQIVEEKKELLKNICHKLVLKPLGFVVTLEALISYLKELEGTPVTAIFINLGEAESVVSLVILGKVKGSETVGRSDDLASDVREALARFGKVNNLPARMILYNGMVDFEDAKQQLASYEWQKELPFLHFPKVSSLDSHISIKAVAIAGGAEVAKSLGFTIEPAEPKEKVSTIADTKEEIISDEPVVATEPTATDLGFLENADIAKATDIKSKTETIQDDLETTHKPETI